MIATGNHSETTDDVVRISKIAGRFLVFDPDVASVLRRQNNTNGTLVGTTPQQPTQNIFLGLPVELRPEEAAALVRNGSAYIVDDAALHKAALTSSNAESRTTYIESLRQSKRAAQLSLNERIASKTQSMTTRQENLRFSVSGSSGRNIANNVVSNGNTSYPHDDSKATNVESLAVTPASSNSLILRHIFDTYNMQADSNAALCGFLQGKGNYMTPGLRFGAQYSVYPGDPLRFHAHFMANEYDWEERIPILDLVEGGRLATAVKKSFLIGGQQLASDSHHSPITTYSVEWAAM